MVFDMGGYFSKETVESPPTNDRYCEEGAKQSCHSAPSVMLNLFQHLASHYPVSLFVILN